MAGMKLINVLLRIKRQREDQACGRFAVAKAKVETLRVGIRRLEAALVEHDRSIRLSLTAAATQRQLSAAMDCYRRETLDVRGELADANASLALARQELAGARLELLEAIARRRGLEQLALSAQRRRMRDQQRQDVKELDQLHQVRRVLVGMSEMSES